MKCCICSLALYGAETWTFREVHQKYRESCAQRLPVGAEAFLPGSEVTGERSCLMLSLRNCGAILHSSIRFHGLRTDNLVFVYNNWLQYQVRGHKKLNFYFLFFNNFVVQQVSYRIKLKVSSIHLLLTLCLRMLISTFHIWTDKNFILRIFCIDLIRFFF